VGASAPVWSALSSEQQTYLAGAPNYTAGAVSFFTAAQRKIVAAMCEVVIPRTDTPGAIDAGVPRFIELMLADWMNQQEREIFSAGLADMEQRIPEQHGVSFDQLEPAQQLKEMEALEDAAGDSPWYNFGNVQREFMSDAPFICQFKELTLWGFFTSEVGVKEVLRYLPMPMQFDGDEPLDRNQSSWGGGWVL
jgi:hypothetical protein